MRPTILTVVIMALLAASSSTFAKTLYVDNQMGNDQTTGLAPQPQPKSGPLRTIRQALRMAQRSDRIVIANTGTPYRESISLSLPRHSGTRSKPFVIEGGGAVLDGSIGHDLGAWRHVQDDVFAMRPRRLTYQQLFTGGQPLPRANILSPYAIDQLQAETWALVDNKIYFRTADQKIPAEYNLRHAGLQTGITLYAVRHVRIENLIVQGFQQDGVNAHERVKDCQLVDMECRANGRAGLSVGGVSRVSVLRSNFYDNGRVQVRTEGLATLSLEACDVDDGTAPRFSASGGSRLMVDGEAIDK